MRDRRQEQSPLAIFMRSLAENNDSNSVTIQCDNAKTLRCNQKRGRNSGLWRHASMPTIQSDGSTSRWHNNDTPLDGNKSRSSMPTMGSNSDSRLSRWEGSSPLSKNAHWPQDSNDGTPNAPLSEGSSPAVPQRRSSMDAFMLSPVLEDHSGDRIDTAIATTSSTALSSSIAPPVHPRRRPSVELTRRSYSAVSSESPPCAHPLSLNGGGAHLPDYKQALLAVQLKYASSQEGGFATMVTSSPTLPTRRKSVDDDTILSKASQLLDL